VRPADPRRHSRNAKAKIASAEQVFVGAASIPTSDADLKHYSALVVTL